MGRDMSVDEAVATNIRRGFIKLEEEIHLAYDADAALAAVKPELRTQTDADVEAPVDQEAIDIFDALHEEIATSQSLSRQLLDAMNGLNVRLEDEWLGGRLRERRARD